MENFIQESTISAYLSVSIIFACFVVGFIVKNYTHCPNHYIPLIMAIAGGVISIYTVIKDGGMITDNTIITGAISGLASCGFYDFISKTLGFKRIEAGIEKVSKKEEKQEEIVPEPVKKEISEEEDVLLERLKELLIAATPSDSDTTVESSTTVKIDTTTPPKNT